LREEQDIVVALSIGTRLRAALAEPDWSYTKLIAAMRRVAAARGESLPGTRSLVTTLSRWFNDHERPSEFYQVLLCEALGKSRAQLGFEDGSQAEAEGGTEPEDLARVLEASNVGPLAISQMETRLARRGEELPTTPPVVLRRPLLDDYRRVVAWLGGSQPAAERRRLYRVAAQLAGMAGTVFFDLRDPARAEAYYEVALRAAGEAGDDAVAAWVLANVGYLEAHRGAVPAALEAVQAAAARATRCQHITTQHAWLAALEAELLASLGEAEATRMALHRAERAIDQARPEARRAGIDFFTAARLPAYMGSCFMLLGQSRLAHGYSAEALELVGPRAKSRWFVRLDLATALVQEGELEEASSLATASLTELSEEDWTPRLEQRVQDFRQELQPFRTARAVQAFYEQFPDTRAPRLPR
jgi:tetratricopeptide (TPR) repeat protein